MEKKITKREYFEAVKTIAEFAEEHGFDFEQVHEVIDFANAEIAKIAASAEKAKATRAEKRKDDNILDVVFAAVTTEPKTAEQLTADIANEEISKGKVVNRLTILVNDGKVVKEDAKTDNGKKTSVYHLA